jgi:ABC-type bacteriocin/lantibiotic exporter with double-glycine peptidase domain
MLVSMMIAIKFGKAFFRLRKKTAVVTDSRIKTITEVLTGMLSVKAFCWEEPFIEKITATRKAEAGHIRQSQTMSGINLSLSQAAPALSTMVTFLVSWQVGNALVLSQVLTVMALLQVLRTSIGKKFVRFMEAFPEAHAAVLRMQAFLLLPEMVPLPAPGPDADGASILFKHASFAWPVASVAEEKAVAAALESSEATCSSQAGVMAVTDISLSVHPGDLVIVNGAVRCAFVNHTMCSRMVCAIRVCVAPHPYLAWSCWPRASQQ